MASPPAPSDVRKVAVVGTGIIGAGWAALFAAKGYSVCAFVRSPASEAKFRKALQAAHASLAALGFATDPEGPAPVTCVRSLAECVSDADYVQESVLEVVGLKQQIIKEIDELAPPGTLIGSSTSFLPVSLISATARRRPERVAIVHPSQPHIDPFAEVFGQSPEAAQWLLDFLGGARLGMDVVLLRREAYGHALNQFTRSITSTMLSLLHKGVVDVRSMDVVLVHLCRLILCANGTGVQVEVIGGGDKKGYVDFVTDITVGFPLAVSAEWVNRLFPRAMVRPLLLFLGYLFSPMRLLKGLFRLLVRKALRPICDAFDDSPPALAAGEARLLKRLAAVDQLLRAPAK